MTEQIIDLATGNAHGGFAAAQNALKLWLQCAIGGADYSVLPFRKPAAFVRLQAASAAFEAAIALLDCWDGKRSEEREDFDLRWSAEVFGFLAKAAGHLLAACEQVERGNRADAWFKKEGELLSFFWRGYWTPGRMISVDLWKENDGQLKVTMVWDTGTGCESSYLSLPSMTDEAERPEGRREGGWEQRGAL